MISRFFIDRPVLATVISIVIFLAGLASIGSLPVEQYPNIVPPQVSVTTSYFGASAEVIASTVAAPLEQEINGVENMIYMNSASSSSGQLALTVTFKVGTDPDQATINVNNRVQSALVRLPEEVKKVGVSVSKRSSSILEIVTLFSPESRYDPIFLSNYALLNVIDDLKRVAGVGDVSLFGAKDYSMRIWLNPQKLLQYKMTPSDVFLAIREQNSQFAPGQFGQEPTSSPQSFTYTATTTGRFSTPLEFENIILRSERGGSTLKLKDVARVELGAQNYSLQASYNGKPSICIGVYLQPGANALATTAAISEKMATLSKNFPVGIEYAIPFDTTKFVEISIHEVIKSFMEAILLVVIVVYLFLQNVRAALIPLVAVPISLVGTFSGMYLLGFSINLLTLFGMLLAIGIVVDDAIVVLENFERILRKENLTPREAAIKAMEEVTGPIIAIVLVLCAVFVPVGFMGGLTGEMYKQFAITIAISVIISGVVALTFTPTLCVLLVKKSPPAPFPSPPSSFAPSSFAPFHAASYYFLERFNTLFDKISALYMRGVELILSKAALALLSFVFLMGVVGVLFLKTPSSLVPPEDQGYIFTVPVLLPGASLDRTLLVTDEITKKLLKHPAVENIVTMGGFDILSYSSKTNTGFSFVVLKDWSKRKEASKSALVLAKEFMKILSPIKEAIVMAFNPPPITGMSTTGGFELYLQNRKGGSTKVISEMIDQVLEAGRKRPELAGLQTTISAHVPQYFMDLDRTKAKALGVSIDAVFTAMQTTFGSFYVNDFTLFGRSYRVSLQCDAEFRKNPEDIKHVFVRSDTGDMISLDTLLRFKRVLGPDLVEHFNIFPAGKILGGPAPGYSSGQAIAAMEDVIAKTVSKDYSLAWTGAAFQEKEASGKGVLTFLFAVIMVFLILAAQYERWSLPVVVVTAIPFAMFGAILAVWLRGLSNDLYFQIGLVTLVGLSAKNAILMVEFAATEHRLGKSILESAREGALLRFRPIVMTSLAFILGCVPLAFSSGAGAESRHSIGTGVIGGMLASTLVATLFVPLFFKLVMQLTRQKEPLPPSPGLKGPS